MIKRAPLAVVAAAFSAGIAWAWWLRPPHWVLWSFTALAAAVFGWRRHRPAWANLSVLILVSTLGAFRAGADAQLPPGSVHALLKETPQPITCEGQVVGDADWIRPTQGPARRQGWLRITRIRNGDRWIPSSGRVLLTLHAHYVPLSYGDRVRLSGSIRGPRPVIIQDGRRRWDEGNWLWIHGASGVLAIAGSEGVSRLKTNPSLWIRYRRWVASFRWRLKHVGRALLGPTEAGYLEALLLGDRHGIPKESWEAFKRSGTLHVLVVSGLHVGLVGFIFFLVLSVLPMERTARYGGLAGLLITYCLLTGAGIPILRATVAGILFCYGRAKGLAISGLNLLGAAALGILAFHPRALADVSFQLSFSAVAGILLWSPVLEKWWNRPQEPALEEAAAGRSFFEKGRQYGIKAWSVSCAAWLATAPFIAWHFQSATPLAPLANLIVVPWASLLVAVGFLVYALGCLNPAWAAPFAAGFGGLAVGLDRLAGWIAQWPGAGLRW